ncbi:MAG: GNAT family N-acetyltransferase [Chloroflexota bacterium]|nr:GNAT family N-acetyltransferase [Chloroflexota bacterium]
MTITVQQGFSETQRTQVAEIYVAAFERKLMPLFKTSEIAIRLVSAELYPPCSLTAADETGRVLGVAGFQHGGKQLLNFSASAMMREFGWFSGAIRYGAAVFFERTPDKRLLQLDGIAVHSEARGMGVGTQMITALETFAIQHGYQGIRLDVVDTNPHARRLYERLGFGAQRTIAVPFLRSLGFTAFTTMVKPVGTTIHNPHPA